MAQRLKSWESPRREGRNSKGKGGSARQRQLKKQQQMLRKKLKGETPQKDGEKRTEVFFSSFYLGGLFGECDRGAATLMNQPVTYLSIALAVSIQLSVFNLLNCDRRLVSIFCF